MSFLRVPFFVFSQWEQSKNRRLKLNPKNIYFRYKEWLSFFFAASIIVFSLITVNYLTPTKQIFDSSEEKIKYATEHLNYYQINEAYEEAIKKDSLNRDLHFNYLLYNYNNNPSKNYILKPKYDSWAYNQTGELKELGLLCSGLIELYGGNYKVGFTQLYSIENKTAKYVNYGLGKVASDLGDYDDATRLYLEEIKNQGYGKGAAKHLPKVYYNTQEWDKLHQLILDPEFSKHISVKIKRRTFLKKLDLENYGTVILDFTLGGTTIFHVLAAIMVTLLWVWYLNAIDVYEPERLPNMIFCFIGGFVLSYLVFPLSDFINFYLRFSLNGDFLNDFLYSTLAIGSIEELVKILPVLILLRGKSLTEPYDYILFGCVSALGFSFSENLLYYKEGFLNSIDSRTLTSVVAHMFFTSVIAYSLVLNRYKNGSYKAFRGLGFFLLASVSHGFYNFWLINEKASSFSILTIIFFLMSVYIWVRITNNAINNSSYFGKLRTLNKKIQVGLFYSFISILMYEYVLTAHTFNPSVANSNLIKGALFTSILTYYLMMNLSELNLVKGYWEPIKLPVTINFNWLKVVPTPKRDYKNLPFILHSKIKDQNGFEEFPWSGHIIDKKWIESDDKWFVVQLDESNHLPLQFQVRDKIVLRAKNDQLQIENQTLTKVYVLLIKSQESLNLEKMKLKDLNLQGLGVIETC